MKKLLTVAILTTLCFLYSDNINAQAFEKGQKNFSIGVGVGYGLGANAALDYGISDVLSIGVEGIHQEATGIFQVSITEYHISV